MKNLSDPMLDLYADLGSVGDNKFEHIVKAINSANRLKHDATKEELDYDVKRIVDAVAIAYSIPHSNAVRLVSACTTVYRTILDAARAADDPKAVADKVVNDLITQLTTYKGSSATIGSFFQNEFYYPAELFIYVLAVVHAQLTTELERTASYRYLYHLNTLIRLCNGEEEDVQ